MSFMQEDSLALQTKTMSSEGEICQAMALGLREETSIRFSTTLACRARDYLEREQR